MPNELLYTWLKRTIAPVPLVTRIPVVLEKTRLGGVEAEEEAGPIVPLPAIPVTLSWTSLS